MMLLSEGDRNDDDYDADDNDDNDDVIAIKNSAFFINNKSHNRVHKKKNTKMNKFS